MSNQKPAQQLTVGLLFPAISEPNCKKLKVFFGKKKNPTKKRRFLSFTKKTWIVSRQCHRYHTGAEQRRENPVWFAGHNVASIVLEDAICVCKLFWTRGFLFFLFLSLSRY
jgi:hypothetical protein